MPKKYLILRKKYPRFVFNKYSWRILNKNLYISFDFKITPDISFKPKIIIENVDKNRIKKIGDGVLNNLIFNLGLIETLSYWKATCSPEIKILAGPLDKKQIKWWKDLILNGMGQFFYENKINFRKPNFLKITNLQRTGLWKLCHGELRNRVLVPIGGGKDSIVTLEILKKARKNITCFSLNPTKASRKIMRIAGCKKPIIVRREIDKKLFELNRQGFLNGHTPFSAYLAFLSVLCAVIFDQKHIAFSNERSSNEGNLRYLGKVINHQYSKSFNFERKFRDYSKKYLAKNVEYFSFLRPLYEIQISKLFSKYPKYFSSFMSCNEAFKTYSGTKKPLKGWCKKCPKCLFIFTSLYPFLGKYRLVKIFGENIFEKISFLPTMLELTDLRKFKPFECVGTKKESLVAFYLSWKKNRVGKRFFLLKYFEKNILPRHLNLKRESKKIMNSWSNQHNLPKEFEKILKNPEIMGYFLTNFDDLL
ncbi:hypothetical protein KJA15_01210 [Patescibacteria group bacterium]|nr:hypothetical protein [Patescibacteria group bacterium]